MEETLKRIQIGESYDSLTPKRQQNSDGSTFVRDEAGGTMLESTRFTVLEIIDRPSNEAEIIQLVRNIWERVKDNQTLIDGKLVFEDNSRLAPQFDPTKLYIVEQ